MFQETLSSLIMIMAVSGIPKNSCQNNGQNYIENQKRCCCASFSFLFEPFKNIDFQELWPFFFLDKTSFVTH